jgi:hypothetical protein
MSNLEVSGGKKKGKEIENSTKEKHAPSLFTVENTFVFITVVIG